MSRPIRYQELDRWVPGRLSLDSEGLGWGRIGLRSWTYEGQETEVPPMQDYLLVGYTAGATDMRRRYDGKWRDERVRPGVVSLLTRAQRVQWTWQEKIEVAHVYLSAGLVEEVAAEALDCVAPKVELHDVLRAEDAAMTHVMAAIAAEARSGGMGGALYVDCLARALAAHLLRRYASVSLPAAAPSAAEFSAAERRRVVELVEDRLGEPLDLATLAAACAMTPGVFARRFRRSFGVPPWAYVMERRLDRARRLLERTQIPIKVVAAETGFSDQAHLTRLFARAFGAPPAAWRRAQV